MINNLLYKINYFEKICLKSLGYSEDDIHKTFSNYFNLNFGKEIEDKFHLNFENWIENNLFLTSLRSPYIYNNFIVSKFDNPESNNFVNKFISKSNDIEKSLIENGISVPTIKNSKIIFGNNGIPNLYYFETSPVNLLKKNKIVDKETAKYDWLFYVMLHNPYSKSNINNISQYNINIAKDFILKNKNKIDKILNIANYSPKFVGEGADSSTFDIGNYILKIYSSKELYNKNLEQLNLLHDNKELSNTEAMIYDVGILGDSDIRTYYYSIMEKMKPIKKNTDVYNFINDINHILANELKKDSSFWDKFKNKINDKKYHNEINVFLKDYSNKISEIVLQDPKLKDIKKYEKDLNLKNNWLKSYIEEIIIKILTKRKDLHIDNLGINSNGYLRFFDPYHRLYDNDDTTNVNMQGW